MIRTIWQRYETCMNPFIRISERPELLLCQDVGRVAKGNGEIHIEQPDISPILPGITLRAVVPVARWILTVGSTGPRAATFYVHANKK